jgi:hypothetical protein
MILNNILKNYKYLLFIHVTVFLQVTIYFVKIRLFKETILDNMHQNEP